MTVEQAFAERFGYEIPQSLRLAGDTVIECAARHGAYVAEREAHPAGAILYKLVLDKDPGILYVEADRAGVYSASTFHGRELPYVPPAARAAVTAYRDSRGPHAASGETVTLSFTSAELMCMASALGSAVVRGAREVPGMCKDGAPGLFVSTAVARLERAAALFVRLSGAASLPRMADSMTARARSAREAADAYIASLEGEGAGR